MSKRLLLILGNFSPEPNGTGKYNGEMVKWLAGNGYECTIITTYPYYPEWKVQPPYTRRKYWYKKEVLQGGSITIYRCPQYVPAKPSGKKRVLQDLSFALSAYLQLLVLLPAGKFDTVITVAPPFHLGLLAVLYKKVRGARFLYHVQDMQIEAARDLRMISSRKLIRTLFFMEKYILEQADVVSSISNGMIRKIQEKAGRDIVFFPNWVDITLFYPMENRDNLKREFGFAPTDKIILYSGAIGEKQGLESILYAAKALKEQHHLKFVICGSGPYKEQLCSLTTALELDNIIFFPLQPFDRFNRFLNMADVHLVVQKTNIGDLVMPSKLTTILAVGGLALITANSGTSLYELVRKYNMGILVDAEDQQAFNEGICRAVSGQCRQITENAREYANRYLSVEKVMREFEKSVSGETHPAINHHQALK